MSQFHFTTSTETVHDVKNRDGFGFALQINRECSTEVQRCSYRAPGSLPHRYHQTHPINRETLTVLSTDTFMWDKNSLRRALRCSWCGPRWISAITTEFQPQFASRCHKTENRLWTNDIKCDTSSFKRGLQGEWAASVAYTLHRDYQLRITGDQNVNTGIILNKYKKTLSIHADKHLQSDLVGCYSLKSCGWLTTFRMKKV
jgi:hypothetical protein